MTSRSQLRRSVVVFLGFLLATLNLGMASTASQEVPATWSITSAGLPEGTIRSSLLAINDSGRAVGNASLESGGRDGVVPMMTVRGRLRVLGPEGATGLATDINDSGVMVGTQYNDDDTRTPTIWGLDDAMPVISEGGWTATGINSDGVVVGTTVLEDLGSGFVVQSGYVWSETEGVNDLPPLIDGAATIPKDINDDGTIVGLASLTPGNPSAAMDVHAVLWEEGEISDLGTLGGEASEATAVNIHGQIVGYSLLADGSTSAFLFEGVEILALPSPALTGCRANDINEFGWIVGFCSSSQSAVAWIDGQFVDLNGLLPAGSGWVLQEAFGINDRGAIVGYGSFNGVTHGFRHLGSRGWFADPRRGIGHSCEEPSVTEQPLQLVADPLCGGGI